MGVETEKSSGAVLNRENCLFKECSIRKVSCLQVTRSRSRPPYTRKGTYINLIFIQIVDGYDTCLYTYSFKKGIWERKREKRPTWIIHEQTRNGRKTLVILPISKTHIAARCLVIKIKFHWVNIGNYSTFNRWLHFGCCRSSGWGARWGRRVLWWLLRSDHLNFSLGVCWIGNKQSKGILP